MCIRDSPLALIIALVFLNYFAITLGRESRLRKEALDKIEEVIAKEHELVSLGSQAAAAAHSLGTPLSTILLIVKEIQKEFGKNEKIKKDLDLLVSQSNRCADILKKLSMNPKIDLPQTLRWEGGELYLLDQTLLPGKVVEERQDSVEQVWDSIKKLKVRGAPAIGIAGAYGLVVAMKAHQDSNLKLFSLNCTNRRNIWMAR